MTSEFDAQFIVFDWDNTLVDTSSELKRTMDKAIKVLVSRGAKLKIPLIREYWQYPLVNLFSNVDYTEYPTYEIIYLESLKESALEKVVFFEGGIELLTLLKQNEKKLYVISNKEINLLTLQIRLTGVSDFFEKVTGFCPNKGVCKPSPEMFYWTLGNNVSADEVLFIGDSQIDEIAAKNFGCNFIYVRNFNFKQTGERLNHPKCIKNLLALAKDHFGKKPP